MRVCGQLVCSESLSSCCRDRASPDGTAAASTRRYDGFNVQIRIRAPFAWSPDRRSIAPTAFDGGIVVIDLLDASQRSAQGQHASTRHGKLRDGSAGMVAQRCHARVRRMAAGSDRMTST